MYGKKALEKYSLVLKAQFKAFDNLLEIILSLFKGLHTIDKYKGKRIGLALIKRIIDCHNGHVWVESKMDEGSILFNHPRK